MFAIFHGNRRRCLAALKEEADNPRNSLAEQTAAASHAVDVYLQCTSSRQQDHLETLLQHSARAGAETRRLAEIGCVHVLARPRVEALVEKHRNQAHIDVGTACAERALRELNVAKSILNTATFEAPDLEHALDGQIAQTEYAVDQLAVAKLCSKGTSLITAATFQECLVMQRMLLARGPEHPSAILASTVWHFLGVDPV